MIFIFNSIDITNTNISSWSIVERRRTLLGDCGEDGLYLGIETLFVIKQFGYPSKSITVGDSGCRIELWWNARQNLLMTNNIAYVDCMYSLVNKFMFKKLAT